MAAPSYAGACDPTCEIRWQGWGRASSIVPGGYDVRVTMKDDWGTVGICSAMAAPAASSATCQADGNIELWFETSCQRLIFVTAFGVAGEPIATAAHSARVCHDGPAMWFE